jgi:hypothetical protein
MKIAQGITACKQYCLAAGATQGNIAYTRTVIVDLRDSKFRAKSFFTVLLKRVLRRKN